MNPRIAPDKPLLERRIAVLAGGIGAEREVSLESGKHIAAAVAAAGFDVLTSDIRPDDLHVLDEPSIDVFFLALHGQFGEDGQLQGILEQRRLVFTGSGSQASRLAFDKAAAKEVFGRAGASVPRHVHLKDPSDRTGLKDRVTALGDRFVVKPAGQGSSVGVEIVADPDTAIEAAGLCLERYGPCLVEAFIPGREITVGILNGRALPLIEIRSRNPFYDYQAKYLDDTTEYRFETIDDAALVEHIQRIAERCFSALGCRHLGRVDMILGEDGVPYVLEINTLPGFTSHSLLPMAARQAGLNAPALCTAIIEAAWADGRPRRTP